MFYSLDLDIALFKDCQRQFSSGTVASVPCLMTIVCLFG